MGGSKKYVSKRSLLSNISKLEQQVSELKAVHSVELANLKTKCGGIIFNLEEKAKAWDDLQALIKKCYWDDLKVVIKPSRYIKSFCLCKNIATDGISISFKNLNSESVSNALDKLKGKVDG